MRAGLTGRISGCILAPMGACSFILIWAVFFPGKSTASEPKKVRFAIQFHSNNDAAAPYVRAAKKFKQLVENRTDGRLQVNIMNLEVFGSGRANRAKAALDALAAGKLEMCDVSGDSVAQAFEPRLNIFDVPYLIRDYEHAERIVSGPIARRLLERLPEHRIAGLAFTYSGGFRIVASRKPLDVENLKNLKVHVVQNEVRTSQFEAWGARPVVAPREDGAFLVLQDKVEAIESTYNQFAGPGSHHGFVRTLPVINELGHNFFVTVMLANNDFLASLPEKDRAALLASANEAAVFERQETIRDNDAVRDQWIRAGGRVAVLPEKSRRALAAASASSRRKAEAIIGGGLIQAVEALAPATQAGRGAAASSLQLARD